MKAFSSASRYLPISGVLVMAFTGRTVGFQAWLKQVYAEKEGRVGVFGARCSCSQSFPAGPQRSPPVFRCRETIDAGAWARS